MMEFGYTSKLTLSGLVIAVNKDYYVDGTAGNDANNGLTWGTAKQTLSNMFEEMPRIFTNGAVVNVYVRNPIVETQSIIITGLKGDGTLNIIGTTTDVQTGILVTGQDNVSTSNFYHKYIDAAAEAWVADAHIGQFIVITAGTGAGSTLYPIISNTATRLETSYLPDTDGTSVVSIVAGNAVTGGFGTYITNNDVAIEVTNMDLDDTGNYTYFQYCQSPITMTNNRFKRLDLTEANVTFTRSYCYVTGANNANTNSIQSFQGCVFYSDGTGLAAIDGSAGTYTVLSHCHIKDFALAIAGAKGHHIALTGDNLINACTTGVKGNGCVLSLNYADSARASFYTGTTGIIATGATIIKGKNGVIQGNPTTEVLLDDTGRSATFADLNANTQNITNLNVGTRIVYGLVYDTDHAPEYSNTINTVTIKTFAEGLDEVATNGLFQNADLDLSENIILTLTTNLNQKGIIYKSTNRFIHDFNYGDNGVVITNGGNLFVGVDSGNFTMGSTATSVSHSSTNVGIGKDTLKGLTTGYGNAVTGVNSGSNITTGYRNAIYGETCAAQLTTGFNNCAYGYYSLVSLQAGYRNSAFGSNTLAGLTASSSVDNVAMGFIAGTSNGLGGNNTGSVQSIFIGANTKSSDVANTNEIVIGFDNTGLGDNTCVIGNTSQTSCSIRGDLNLANDILLTNTTHANEEGIIRKGGNLFIHDFNYGNNGVTTTIGFNTFIGIDAGNLTSGLTASSVSHSSQNTFVGHNAGKNITTAYDNTVVGAFAFDAATTAAKCCAFGERSLTSILTGINDAAFGENSLENLSTGSNHVALGCEALRYTTTTHECVAVGYQAGAYYTGGVGFNNTTPTQSIFIGTGTKAATAADTNQIVIGYDNTGLGTNTCVIGNTSQTLCSIRGDLTLANDILLTNTTHLNEEGIIRKNSNLFIHDFNYGDNGVVITNGNNTFVGEGSGNLTTGATATSTSHSSNNTACGKSIFSSIAKGYNNSALGYRAGFSVTEGSNNAFFGQDAGYSLTTGDYNTFFGSGAGGRLISNGSNVFIGFYAGTYYGVSSNNTSTSNSVYIGTNTKANTASDTNQIVIGYGAVGLGSNTTVIGNSSTTITELKGKLGVGTDAPNSKLEIKGFVEASAGATAFNRVASLYSNDSTYDQEIHLGVLPVDVDTVLRFAGGDANGTFGKGYFLKHNKTDNTLEIGINTGGNIDTDSADFSFLSNEMKFLDSGNNSNSSKISFIGDNGGTKQIGSIFVAYGANPYMRISVPDVTGAETAVIDVDDDKMTFVTDNSMDIGTAGANRPKNIYAAGNITLDGNLNIGGSVTKNVTTVNAATYDLATDDYYLHVTYTGTAAVTSLTLMSAQTIAGREIVIKDAGGNASANNITIDTEGAETIDGQATLVLSQDYDKVTLYSDGSNWFTA